MAEPWQWERSFAEAGRLRSARFKARREALGLPEPPRWQDQAWLKTPECHGGRIVLGSGEQRGTPCPADLIEDNLARMHWRAQRGRPLDVRGGDEPAAVPPCPRGRGGDFLDAMTAKRRHRLEELAAMIYVEGPQRQSVLGRRVGLSSRVLYDLLRRSGWFRKLPGNNYAPFGLTEAGEREAALLVATPGESAA